MSCGAISSRSAGVALRDPKARAGKAASRRKRRPRLAAILPAKRTRSLKVEAVRSGSPRCRSRRSSLQFGGQHNALNPRRCVDSLRQSQGPLAGLLALLAADEPCCKEAVDAGEPRIRSCKLRGQSAKIAAFADEFIAAADLLGSDRLTR